MTRGEIEKVALFDLDGTLCDHDWGLANSLNSLRSPEEKIYDSARGAPEYIKNRTDLIRASSSWWENLEKFRLGWDVLDIAKELEFNIMILTQGPRKNPDAWAGKKKWIDKNLGPDTDMTITRDKGLVYGKVLVDDYPGYVDRWLSWRERGLVIMPANEENKDYKHPQVIRYDGTNLEQVRDAMEKARDRKRGEDLKF